jgi:uncharacterized protein DUF4446
VTEGLTSTTGMVALAAAAVAAIALITAVVLAFRLAAVRRAQTLVLGEAGQRDLVQHAQRVERGFGELRSWAEEVLTRIDQRVGTTEARLDGCVAYRALVRYDAYGEMSGRQSSSVALLDRHRSGVVISSILHRDQARVYVKQVHEGTSDLDLSPEELQAIDVALAAELS